VLVPGVRSASTEIVEGVDELVGADPNPPVFGQLAPRHPAVGRNDENAGTGDVATVDAARGVNEAEGGDELAIRIGQDREFQPELVDDSPVVIYGIHRDGDHLGAGGADIGEA